VAIVKSGSPKTLSRPLEPSFEERWPGKRDATNTIAPSVAECGSQSGSGGCHRGFLLVVRSMNPNRPRPTALRKRQAHVVQRPADLNAFEFTVLACLRAGQLVRRSVPRVEGAEKVAITAQLEVAARKIVRAVNVTVVGP